MGERLGRNGETGSLHLPPTSFGPNASGSNFDKLIFLLVLPLPKMNTSALGPNSLITCRHAPHGGVSFFVGVTMTTALSFCRPCATAWKMAFRSAHIVSP